MADNKTRILLAEDDLNLGVLLTDFLESEGFDVKLCKDGELALKAFREQPFDLYLLDIMMPKADGFTVAREIRVRDAGVPIIFITARTLKEDKLKGYGLGADDYITKPFDEEELVWKLRAVMRRVQARTRSEAAVSIGRYTFDYANQCLVLQGKQKRMTEKENEVLRYLSDHRNHLIRREEMVESLWGKKDYFLGRSLDVFITKIRKYLAEDPEVNVENVFGVGFIFNVPEQQER
jgi:DNA-binding response OmpR family regulator